MDTRLTIVLIAFLIALAVPAMAQDPPGASRPDDTKKEVKSVPSADKKAKPAKISSSARPKINQPNQPPGQVNKPNGASNSGQKRKPIGAPRKN